MIATRWSTTGFRALSLALTVGLSACEKAADTIGTLEATILPAGQVNLVTVTAANGTTYHVTPEAATGKFRFAELPAGMYTLTIAPTAAYKVPGPVAVEVKAGITTRPSLGPLTRDHQLRGTLRWTQGGVSYTAQNLYGEVKSSFVSLDGYVKVGDTGHEVGIVLPGYGTSQPFHGVGTYRLGVQEYPFGLYKYSPPQDHWEYYTSWGSLPLGTGTVTVTHYDEYRIAGTFAFEAGNSRVSNGSAPATMQVSQGSFDLTY